MFIYLILPIFSKDIVDNNTDLRGGAIDLSSSKKNAEVQTLFTHGYKTEMMVRNKLRVLQYKLRWMSSQISNIHDRILNLESKGYLMEIQEINIIEFIEYHLCNTIQKIMNLINIYTNTGERDIDFLYCDII